MRLAKAVCKIFAFKKALIATIECVPGFFDGAAWKHVLAVAEKHGYKLVFSELLDSIDAGLRQSRRRKYCVLSCIGTDQSRLAAQNQPSARLTWGVQAACWGLL